MMQSFSAIKKDAIMVFARKCTEIKINMLGEISQAQNWV